MKKIDKHIERELRAARLKEAKEKANIGGYRKLSNKFGWNENTFKSHESRGSFEQPDARKYAKAFGVSVQWLYMGIGDPDDLNNDPVATIDVPLISWVSAGALGEQQAVVAFDEFPTVTAIDLPDGDWIALRVDGNSMNKISPPDSIVLANRRDKRLVANACYIVADETGSATYKRYRPNDDPPFQPASYDDVPPPKFQGEVSIIGRVRRSIIDM